MRRFTESLTSRFSLHSAAIVGAIVAIAVLAAPSIAQIGAPGGIATLNRLTIDTVATPAAPTVTPQGTTGATTYSYRISAVNAIGETLASTAGTTATGNAALSGSNFNRVTWAGVPGAAAYKVYGRSSGSELLIATVAPTLNRYDDTGAVTPSGALPSSNTTGGRLGVGKTAGAGTLSDWQAANNVYYHRYYSSGGDDIFGWYTPDGVELRLYDINNATDRLRFLSTGVTVGGDVSATDQLFERGRSAAVGEWTNVAHNAANFTASGSMTWTVASGDQIAYSYTLIGKTMILRVEVQDSSVGGTASTNLNVAIPGGFLAAGTSAIVFDMFDAGVGAIGYARTVASGSVVELYRQDRANWSLSTNTTNVAFTLSFQVQ